jgi:hypothetical protein
MTEPSRDRIVRAALQGTGVFAATAIAAAAGPDPLVVVAVVVDLALFAVGCGAFVVTLVQAAARSRDDALTLMGIWWLERTAPRGIRRRLLGCLGAQTLVAVATAAVEPTLAFGILVPVFGLGLTGLWSVRRGNHPPRV